MPSLLMVFTFLPMTFIAGLPIQFWIKQICMYVFWIGVFYLTLLVLAPKLLYKSRGLIFGICAFAIICFSYALNNWLEQLINLPAIMQKYVLNGYSQVGNLSVAVITAIIIGIAIINAVTRKIQSDQLREKALENQKISTELSFLKSQINPHFFFNVLHTIYGLTELDPAKAKDSIYTLSHMMRYVLYDTKSDVTTLEKELLFIDNYIKLMQLRISNDVQVIFDKPANFQNTEIAPMLFLPLVENAFKHGISTVHPSFIYIGVSRQENTLFIEVRNSNFDEKAADMEESNGIGLVNTQRRLNLLYPGKHTLNIQDLKETEEFIVQLRIFLT